MPQTPGGAVTDSMDKATLEGGRLTSGRWQAELVVPGAVSPPLIEVLHDGVPLDGIDVGAPLSPGRWPVAVDLPASVISDGVQTFVVRDVATDAVLGQFTLIAGDPLAEDLRAEIALLRAELDLLKKAFRRYCREAGSH